MTYTYQEGSQHSTSHVIIFYDFFLNIAKKIMSTLKGGVNFNGKTSIKINCTLHKLIFIKSFRLNQKDKVIICYENYW